MNKEQVSSIQNAGSRKGRRDLPQKNAIRISAFCALP
jgi:hypothetical protein